MKKVFSIMLVLILCVSMFTIVNVSAATTADISMGTVTGKVGDTVSVDLTLNSNPGFTTLGVNVNFDKTKLQLVAVENKKVLAGITNTGIDTLINTANQVTPYLIVWQDNMTSANSTDKGKLATFKFKILDAADIGKNPITITVKNCYQFNDVDVATTTNSGAVNVTVSNEDKTASLEIVDDFTLPSGTGFEVLDMTEMLEDYADMLNGAIGEFAEGKVFTNLLSFMLYAEDASPVELTGTVKVKLAIPDDVKELYKDFALVSLSEGDTEDDVVVADMNATVVDGYLVFETDNFDANMYAIIGSEIPEESSTPSTSSAPATDDDENPVTADNATTGFALILLVVAAAGIMVTSKKVRA